MKQVFSIFLLILLAACNNSEFKKPSTTKDEPTLKSENPEKNTSQINTHEIELYQFYDLEENTGKKIAFVSLSDNYPLSDNEDSVAIPNLDNIQDKKELEFFKLDKKYRKRFLERMGISESDSVFIYDYSTDILLSFEVKRLDVAANLSIYSYQEIYEYPLTQFDYEIGFVLNKSVLGKLDLRYNLVFVGEENPFTQGQMNPIVWTKINSNQFPSKKSKLSYTLKNAKRGKSYLYNTDKLQYFLQDFSDSETNEYIVQRHIMIVDKETEKVIIERLFTENEGTSMAPLNDSPNYIDSKEQWTGKLFKHKPEVVFGFEWFSFGCANIIFLQSKVKDIYINCDNRH